MFPLLFYLQSGVRDTHALDLHVGTLLYIVGLNNVHSLKFTGWESRAFCKWELLILHGDWHGWRKTLFDIRLLEGNCLFFFSRSVFIFLCGLFLFARSYKIHSISHKQQLITPFSHWLIELLPNHQYNTHSHAETGLAFWFEFMSHTFKQEKWSDSGMIETRFSFRSFSVFFTHSSL